MILTKTTIVILVMISLAMSVTDLVLLLTRP